MVGLQEFLNSKLFKLTMWFVGLACLFLYIAYLKVSLNESKIRIGELSSELKLAESVNEENLRVIQRLENMYNETNKLRLDREKQLQALSLDLNNLNKDYNLALESEKEVSDWNSQKVPEWIIVRNKKAQK